MSRAGRWTCPGCCWPLGAVDRRGTLVVAVGGRNTRQQLGLDDDVAGWPD